MQVAEFNHEDFEVSQQAKQDEALLVKFYTKSVQDTARSASEGRPVFKDVEYVDIRIPGSRDGAARPATVRDKARFPRHYQAFQQRIELPEEGTPLLEWPPMSRSMAEEMAFFNIKTVEQLANVSDGVAGQYMGAAVYKQKAIAWLEMSRKDVTVEHLQGELASRDKMLEQLQEQLDTLQARMEEE